jgi:hypothetical protein
MLAMTDDRSMWTALVQSRKLEAPPQRPPR